MDRRSFINQAAIAGLFLAQAKTHANEEFSDWVDVPGFNGRLKSKALWVPETPATQKASCKLFAMESGVIIPRHLHPEGEFTYVVEGSFHIEGAEDKIFSVGDSVYMPPGSIHEANISHGVTVLSFTPSPIQFRF